jgi:predicted phage baseplate assembly protein
MPIRPPALDDRSYDDLVAELVARIPAHTPEWTHPRAGDPGRTLIELFAWLGDTILYRANLVPERQRLAFLRLLGMPLTPARPARGLVAIAVDDARDPKRVDVAPGSVIEKPVPFRVNTFATVFPLEGKPFARRPLDDDEKRDFEAVASDLSRVYGITGQTVGYITTEMFPKGAMSAAGYDVIANTVDRALWVALLAPSAKLLPQARRSLESDEALALNVGVALAYDLPALSEDIGSRARIPVLWEISSGRSTGGEAEMVALEVLQDGTDGLSRHGVVRLGLPPATRIGAPENDPRRDLQAGVGNQPPRLDDPADADRLVAWLRLRVRPGFTIETLKLAWVGINAVEIEQREVLPARSLGTSDGGSDQSFDLGVAAKGSVDGAALVVEVNDPTVTQRSWTGVQDLGAAGPLDCVYRLDAEAGTITFGDGVHGRVPANGAEIVARELRVGGGARGNLPPGTLAKVDAVIDAVTGSRRKPELPLKVLQALPVQGGVDAETVDAAERRIPGYFRHRDRAVTAEDYRALAKQAPGVEVGRVEVLPRFKPQEKQGDIPGVVSVMVLPARESVDYQPPYPRADRPLLETVHAFLDERRPVATELYTIGCVYKPLGVAVAVQLRDGYVREQVLLQVRLALRRHLWPLPLGVAGSLGDWPESGRSDGGYPLGRDLTDRELEVVVARVPGVAGVSPVNLFEVKDGKFVAVAGAGKAVSTFTLEDWELPELTAVAVVEGTDAPASVDMPFPSVSADGGATAVPVAREKC